MSRIIEKINYIERFIDESKATMMSKDKVTIDKNTMFQLLEELKDCIPSEIETYQKVINNKEAIIANAKNEANNILLDARRMTEQLVDEHEIMQKAYDSANLTIEDANSKANQILERANDEANNIRLSAINYTDNILSSLELIISRSLDDVGARFLSYTDSLKANLDVVVSNREELSKTLNKDEN